jgi:hypothetical protein
MLPDIVARIGKQVDSEMRSVGLLVNYWTLANRNKSTDEHRFSQIFFGFDLCPSV